jgi:hypothetical protein
LSLKQRYLLPTQVTERMNKKAAAKTSELLAEGITEV